MPRSGPGRVAGQFGTVSGVAVAARSSSGMGMPVGRGRFERGTHLLIGSASAPPKRPRVAPPLIGSRSPQWSIMVGSLVLMSWPPPAKTKSRLPWVPGERDWRRLPMLMLPSVPRRIEAQELSAKWQTWLLSAVVPVGQGSVAVAFWQSWSAIVDWRVLFRVPTRELMMAFFTGDQSVIPARAQVQAWAMQQRASH